jgi:tRNA A-37 threonylcarbamoyl transferase component Bud32
MPTPTTCPHCNGILSPESPQGLCPACLLKAALDDPGSAPTIGGVGVADAVKGMRVRYMGDYELLEEIAHGGMGVIYKARQLSLNRTVALKMIRSGELATEADVRRFRVEAEAAANLQHPNIVAIHEVGVHEGHHYFTMDFVEGRNLGQVADGKPMAARRAAGYAKTIAEAIQFAHQRGTLHRDLKPQNVLLDEADRVRITDFGLAKQTKGESHLTMTGAVMGSPSYMPPEQARGRQDLVGPASDVYGIGAILYELLTGRAPFRGDTAAVTMMKVMEEEPAAPSKLNPSVPRDLETVCLKCLEKSVERRYPTARALAEDLGRFLDGEPVQARPASALRKAVSWSRRHRWVIVAVASTATLGLAGLAFGLWEQTRYLLWVNAHPGWIAYPGELNRNLRNDVLTSVLPIPLFWAMVLALQYYRRQSRRMSWGELRRTRGFAPAYPIAQGWAAAFMTFGLFGIAFSLWLVTRHIQAYVWEGAFPFAQAAVIWVVAIFSAQLTSAVVREQWGSALGLRPVDDAPIEQATSEAVRDALVAGHRIEAIRAYRAQTGADPAQAHRHVLQLADAMYREHPERFARDPTLPAPVDVRRRLATLVLAVLAVVVTGVVLVVPPAARAAWGGLFAAGTAAGVLVALARSRRSRWQRIVAVLLAVVALAAALAGYRQYRPQHDAASGMAPMFFGLLAGLLLIVLSRRERHDRPGG